MPKAGSAFSLFLLSACLRYNRFRKSNAMDLKRESLFWTATLENNTAARKFSALSKISTQQIINSLLCPGFSLGAR